MTKTATPIQLKSGFPKVWGDLSFQNRWLRFAVMLCLGITTLSVGATAALIRRKPIILALDYCASPVNTVVAAPIEAEVEKAARQYLDYRYSWGQDNQSLRLQQAKSFVAGQSVKAFEKTVSDLLAFSKGKNVSQRIYPTSVRVDVKNGRIQVSGDRFTEIQGLKAATLLRVTLSYQEGVRTIENPWGIYIVKEEEG